MYLLITFRRDHAVFDADHAILPGPVPRHPGDRASEAHPVQKDGGRRGGAEWAVQLRLPVFLLATRVAEGRGVLDVMAVSTLVRNETCTEVPKFPKFIPGRSWNRELQDFKILLF